MKLRNKKTGEIYSMWHICIGGEEITSVKQFNDMFEDYTPQEPRLKDKEVRKIVRGWAYQNNVREVIYTERENRALWCLTSCNDDYNFSIKFIGWCPTLKDGETYTIAELCGEGDV